MHTANRLFSLKRLNLVRREVKLVVFHHDGQQWKALMKSPGYYD